MLYQHNQGLVLNTIKQNVLTAGDNIFINGNVISGIAQPFALIDASSLNGEFIAGTLIQQNDMVRYTGSRDDPAHTLISLADNVTNDNLASSHFTGFRGTDLDNFGTLVLVLQNNRGASANTDREFVDGVVVRYVSCAATTATLAEKIESWAQVINASNSINFTAEVLDGSLAIFLNNEQARVIVPAAKDDFNATVENVQAEARVVDLEIYLYVGPQIITATTTPLPETDPDEWYQLSNLLNPIAGPGVVNDLTSSSTFNALAANQGRVLDNIKQNNLIAGTGITIVDDTISASVGGLTVVDNLLSTSAVDALSANQGRELNIIKQAKLVAGNNVTLTDNTDNTTTVDSLQVTVIDDLAATEATAALSANQGRVLNIIKQDLLTAGTGIDITNNVISSTGAATNEATRNDILLAGGFILLVEGTVTGTRTQYTGSIAGFTSTDYFFDSADDSWYDAVTGGNRLIGFI